MFIIVSREPVGRRIAINSDRIDAIYDKGSICTLLVGDAAFTYEGSFNTLLTALRRGSFAKEASQP